MDFRKSTPWSVDEVQTFLCVVANERIQRELDGSTRNEQIYQEVAKLLAAHGYHRTFKQCREKLKKMKSDYRTIKSRGGLNRKRWKWYDQMDAIYGHRPASVMVEVKEEDLHHLHQEDRSSEAMLPSEAEECEGGTDGCRPPSRTCNPQQQQQQAAVEKRRMMMMADASGEDTASDSVRRLDVLLSYMERQNHGDQYDRYTQTVADFMRSLSRRRCAVFKKRLNDLMYEMDLEEMDDFAQS